ncbi:HepT-like ribonuclease domain-containing protein [Pseudomonas putida]|uniref:HepT-like ribonuclease domain-containing protein n=1 Tax=Pseudomonas putida TaxID=303 RepID=UPI002159F1C5|nr:HepT-like ribonuclease domain-containing protein [Pseudomonas putida]
MDPANGKERTGDLKEFAATYNSIEDQLTKVLRKLEMAAEPATSKNLSKITSTRIADILHSRKLISSDLLEKLKKLIALRNAILHGAEPMVSQSMVLESKLTLIQLLTEIETNITKV